MVGVERSPSEGASLYYRCYVSLCSMAVGRDAGGDAEASKVDSALLDRAVSTGSTRCPGASVVSCLCVDVMSFKMRNCRESCAGEEFSGSGLGFWGLCGDVMPFRKKRNLRESCACNDRVLSALNCQIHSAATGPTSQTLNSKLQTLNFPNP
jgi:hypothetical protein